MTTLQEKEIQQIIDSMDGGGLRVLSVLQESGEAVVRLVGEDEQSPERYTRLYSTDELAVYLNGRTHLTNEQVKQHIKETINNRIYTAYRIGLDIPHTTPLLEYYRQINEVLRQQGVSPWFKLNEDGVTGLTTVSYLHAGVNFSDERSRMARGLTLDKDSQIILRGFSKFFNYRQLESYDMYGEQFKNEFSRANLSDGKKYKYMDKMDGSLIILGTYKDKLVCSTTSSIDNAMAVRATHYFNRLDNAQELHDVLEAKGLCACFEWVGPYNRVVVEYDTEDYVLLALINKETGRRHQHDTEYNQFAQQLNFSVPAVYHYTLAHVQELMAQATDIEGFVLENEYGNLIKFKTDSWFKMSNRYGIFFGTSLTRNKVRMIIETYLVDDLDDLYGFSEESTKLINQVIEPVKEIEHEVDTLYILYKERSELIGTNKALAEIGRNKEIDSVVKSTLFNKIKKQTYFTEQSVTLLTEYVLNKTDTEIYTSMDKPVEKWEHYWNKT